MCLLRFTYHGARAGHDLGGLPLGADLAESGPLPKLLAGVHLHVKACRYREETQTRDTSE